jgi:hypothetical protein
MRGIILDVPDFLMSFPIIDVLVDVVTYVPWWKVATEIIVCPLINLLVVTTIGLNDIDEHPHHDRCDAPAGHGDHQYSPGGHPLVVNGCD